VRSAGADGSGHSPWSEAEVVCMPAPREGSTTSSELARLGSARSVSGPARENDAKQRRKVATETGGQRRQPVKSSGNFDLFTPLTSGPFGDSMSTAARPKRWGVSRQTQGREFNPTRVEFLTLLT
jgi:hypothetical protein